VLQNQYDKVFTAQASCFCDATLGIDVFKSDELIITNDALVADDAAIKIA